MADRPLLASHVGVSVGLLMVLHGGRPRARGDIDGLIELPVIMLVAMVVLWQFALACFGLLFQPLPADEAELLLDSILTVAARPR